ncbi:MAG: hypothetical protein LQ341_000066 [Variospora aurantia]|nr:MAG: hypothetical protein LQ341_000066 [Variospora aurantia]
MSWQAYVDTRYEVTAHDASRSPTYAQSSLVATGNIDKAAIFNSEGTSAWAASAGFTVAPAEIEAVVTSFADNSDVKKVQSEGFHVAGEKFFTIKSDDRSLYGKKGKEGVVIVKTQQAILVAHYPESVQPGAAANTVEQLGDYLIGVGY